MSKLYDDIDSILTDSYVNVEKHEAGIYGRGYYTDFVFNCDLATPLIAKYVLKAQIELLEEILADSSDFPVSRRLKDLQKQLEA